jgi:ElaB/YqjD/DUF883 family membrane-anchored ribosome-binding protein
MKENAEAISGPNESTTEYFKRSLARGLKDSAHEVHKTANRPDAPESLANAGHKMAEWLDKSADYVSDFDIEGAGNKVREQIRTHPGRSLGIAAVAGLVLGALIWRR